MKHEPYNCECCGVRPSQVLVDVTHYVCDVCEPRFKRSNVKKIKWKKERTYRTPKWIVEFQRRFQER